MARRPYHTCSVHVSRQRVQADDAVVVAKHLSLLIDLFLLNVNLNSGPITLQATYRGQIVLLLIVITWLGFSGSLLLANEDAGASRLVERHQLYGLILVVCGGTKTAKSTTATEAGPCAVAESRIEHAQLDDERNNHEHEIVLRTLQRQHIAAAIEVDYHEVHLECEREGQLEARRRLYRSSLSHV